jgi:uncharacterized protein (DUF1778 family)
MSPTPPRRQRIPKYPVSAGRMRDEEIRVIDEAAALRGESRGAYMARVILREARADIRRAAIQQERYQAAS